MLVAPPFPEMAAIFFNHWLTEVFGPQMRGAIWFHLPYRLYAVMFEGTAGSKRCCIRAYITKRRNGGVESRLRGWELAKPLFACLIIFGQPGIAPRLRGLWFLQRSKTRSTSKTKHTSIGSRFD